MVLLIPLLTVTLAVRLAAGALVNRGRTWAAPWSSWSAAAAAGLSAVFVSTGVAHFTEPKRSGLEAIVPAFIPNPELVITLSGLAEFCLATGLLIPRTRRWAALAATIFLIAVFPANVVAAGGTVDHPAAPTTHLLPRTLLQLCFLIAAAAPLVAGARGAAADAPERDRLEF